MVLDAVNSFELFKTFYRSHPQVAHVVKTYNTHEKHVITSVLAVIKTWIKSIIFYEML